MWLWIACSLAGLNPRGVTRGWFRATSRRSTTRSTPHVVWRFALACFSLDISYGWGWPFFVVCWLVEARRWCLARSSADSSGCCDCIAEHAAAGRRGTWLFLCVDLRWWLFGAVAMLELLAVMSRVAIVGAGGCARPPDVWRRGRLDRGCELALDHRSGCPCPGRIPCRALSVIAHWRRAEIRPVHGELV